MNQLYLPLLLLIPLNLSAQDRSITLLGKVTSDSLAIENVHIINKSSKEGAISDHNGEFKITVKLNDTLVFSAIQFYMLEVKVIKQIVDEKYLRVELLQKINTLNEVVLKTHDLSGNLILDASNMKDTVQKANPVALNFDGIYIAPSSIVAKKLNSNYLPDVTDPMAPIGGDILGLALFVFEPLIKEVSKIGKTKRDIKKKEREYQKEAITSPDKIRTELGDTFFINDLNISTDQIDAFILHCSSKGLIDLFLKNKKLEMINILIKESQIYKNN